MNPPMVNGDQVNGVPHSAFLEHLLKYPLISDSVSTIQSYPLAQQSLSLTQNTYNRISEPLKPYLQTPYTYISPYLSRADTLGDNTLNHLDARFPIVKKPTGEVVASAKSAAFLPVRVGQEGRDHVMSVYSNERKGLDGDGIVQMGRAVAATALVLTAEGLAQLRSVLVGVKEAGKGKGEN